MKQLKEKNVVYRVIKGDEYNLSSLPSILQQKLLHPLREFTNLNDAVKKADNRNSIDLNFMSRRHKTEKK
jgi:hypothetical protein